MNVSYEKQVGFLGRNGMFAQTGMSINNYGNQTKVTLEPITSKGWIGRSSLEIPMENVSSVIRALEKSANLDTVTLTRDQWNRIKMLIDHAIQFGEQQPNAAETHRFTLLNLLEREAAVKKFVPC